MSLIVVLVLFGATQLLTAIPGAAAQNTNATCIPSYEWAYNSRGQSPCMVASYLQGVCAEGVFTMRALPAGSHYAGPTLELANPCYCSTVVYSLVSACGDCQEETYEDWTDWRINCTVAYPSEFPMDIPSGTSVPSWAYLDVVTSDRYNPGLAQQDASSNTVESTRTASQTSSSTSTSTSTQNPSSVSTNSNVSTTGTKAGAIAGGVVGGVVFLALVGALIFFLILRRRRTRTAPSALYRASPGLGVPPPMSQHTLDTYSHRGFSRDVTGTSPPKIYDPSDPTTFPSQTVPVLRSGYATSFEPPSPGSADYTYASTVPNIYSGYHSTLEPQSPGTPDYTHAGHLYTRYNGTPEV